jgi:hypothetical protein
MNKVVIGGIAGAGLVIVGGIVIGVTNFAKNCKKAHDAGLTLKEFKAIKKEQKKAAKEAAARMKADTQVQNAVA